MPRSSALFSGATLTCQSITIVNQNSPVHKLRIAAIIREGSGAGDSTAITPGQAHEFASKAAETDATKRALSTFGNAFGLSLYRGTTEPPPPQPNRFNGSSAAPAPIAAVPTTLEVSRENPPEGGKVPPPVDKSVLARAEPKRLRDLEHLKFVANQPCLICGRQPSHAHHLTFTQPNALGRKVSDEFTVPLCNLHHRELHDHGNERTWWIDRKMNPLPDARELWTRSHDWSLPPDAAPVLSESTGPSPAILEN